MCFERFNELRRLLIKENVELIHFAATGMNAGFPANFRRKAATKRAG
jgi:hypothetical protein